MGMALLASEALGGKPRWAQGGAIATLACAWIVASAGEDEAQILNLLETHCETVRKLLPAMRGEGHGES
jgi:hypothetical protein